MMAMAAVIMREGYLMHIMHDTYDVDDQLMTQGR